MFTDFRYFLLHIISFRIQKILFRFKTKQAKLAFISLRSFSLSFRFVSLPSEIRGHPKNGSLPTGPLFPRPYSYCQVTTGEFVCSPLLVPQQNSYNTCFTVLLFIILLSNNVHSSSWLVLSCALAGNNCAAGHWSGIIHDTHRWFC